MSDQKLFRSVLVMVAVTIGDDDPTPSGVADVGDFVDYLAQYGEHAVVAGVYDRAFPENNVEPQLFAQHMPLPLFDGGYAVVMAGAGQSCNIGNALDSHTGATEEDRRGASCAC